MKINAVYTMAVAIPTEVDDKYLPILNQENEDTPEYEALMDDLIEDLTKILIAGATAKTPVAATYDDIIELISLWDENDEKCIAEFT